jgi:outer membrane immunogenic protein
MKLLLIASAGLLVFGATMARAPDTAQPVYEAAPSPPPLIWRWTGCYIGADVGNGWGDESGSDPLLGGVSPSTNGWLAAGQIGCNNQADAVTFGLEGEHSWDRLKVEKLHFTSAATNTSR